MVDGVAQYGMSRGCSKSPSSTVSGSEAIDGYTNVMAVTSGCSSSSCNKVAGSTGNLPEGNPVAVQQPQEPAEPEETEDEGGDEGGDEPADGGDSATTGDDTSAEAGAAETMLSALLLLAFTFF